MQAKGNLISAGVAQAQVIGTEQLNIHVYQSPSVWGSVNLPIKSSDRVPNGATISTLLVTAQMGSSLTLCK